jgi:outer membrane protein OmpA-like peptidoglycan-associated protein
MGSGGSSPNVPQSVPVPRNLTFGSTSSSLTPGMTTEIDALATKLKSGASVTITGFSQGNEALAKKRAETVERLLERLVHVHVTLKIVTSKPINRVGIVTTNL